MRMSAEDYKIVLSAFRGNKQLLIEHRAYVEKEGRYTVLDKRVAWDCCYHLLGKDFISYQYGKGLKDTHISTGIVKAYKQVLSEE